MTPAAILPLSDTEGLSYIKTDGAARGVLFLHGYMSDKNGAKAEAVDAVARARGHACVRFDYRGHGASTGTADDFCISQALADATAVLEHLTDGEQVVVGSSLGGWVALLLALRYPQRVKALVLVAPAPDFTEDLMWARMDAATRQQIMANGVFEKPNPYSSAPYRITRRLIEDGRDHLLLRAPIAYRGAVHLLHGKQDADVPYQTSLKIAERLGQRENVTLELVDDGDHRLSRPSDLARLTAAVEKFLIEF